jgi:hypothetical protein
MSLFIDVKYLRLISPRLPLFKEKGRNTWICRCVLCGDSKKKSNKKRFYFYVQKSALWGKCHNCGWAGHFGTFLKDLDAAMYQQYVYERFAEDGGGKTVAHKNAAQFMKQDAPVFKKKEPIIDEFGLTSLSLLPDDNEAVQYCLKRQIPREQFSKLFFLEHTKDIIKLFPQYESLAKSEEPRLAIPLESFNEVGGCDHDWTGMALRALRGEQLRYINVKDEDVEGSLIFGLSSLDRTQPILVVEGPIDSLFLPNCIAVVGTAFSKLDDLYLSKQEITVVFDNEPRNAEVCNLLEQYIRKGYEVCIWPASVKPKDINEMVLAGLNPHDIIKANSHSGLLAELYFTDWKKC